MTPLRILQVDDSDDEASLVCLALVRAGFEVYAQRVDTVASLRRELSSADWDLVIADYTMPGFTGTTALAIVREQHPELPFIFVSSASGEDAAVSAMRTGAGDYVMKGNLARLGPAVERELRDAAVRRERQLANQRVAYLADHDALADLPNRPLFHDRLPQALQYGHRIYNAARDPRIDQGVSMATALRQALDQRQFDVDYQPIVHLPTGVVTGIESLVRWNHPEHGRLLPDDFIRVAEQTGLVNPLTGFVLERALSEWPVSTMPATCAIAVNVSPRSLHHAAFPGRVSELLDTYGTPASSLTLELTEHLVMSDPDRSARCLHQLHEMGVTLAIDDFGRGYTSLSYLRRLPVDQLKIDRSFLVGLADGEDDTLVRSMIDLAHNLGMQVVAQGVETEGVYQQLVELGCDAAQGYHVCRPAPASGVAEWIERRQAAG